MNRIVVAWKGYHGCEVKSRVIPHTSLSWVVKSIKSKTKSQGWRRHDAS